MAFGQTSPPQNNSNSNNLNENTAMQYKMTNVSANSANTDVGTFTGLPARYFITNLYFYDPSAPMSNATFDLMSLPNGGGDQLMTRFKVSALTDTMQYTPAIISTKGAQTLRTESTLYLRNIAAEGVTRTLSAMLEIKEI